MNVTLEDIARASGFSLPTVSRVLSDSSYPVSPATRRRVLDVAQSMGYTPNLAARGLRTRRTHTVGIVVDDIMSPFVPPIVRGIQDRLAEDGLSGLLVNADWNPDSERAAIASLLSRPVDGILFVEYSHLDVDEALGRSGKPHLFVHRLFGASIENSVVPDDHYGATLAVDHLIGLGHRRIALISGPATWHNARARFDGYCATLAAHGIPVDAGLISYGDWEKESGHAAAAALLAASPRPTAIFAANDLMALGAVYAAQDAGLRVPGDVAVVGYDNRHFARIVRPALTTVSMPMYEMGQIAAGLLAQQIGEGAGKADRAAEVKVKGRLFVRETCGGGAAQRTADDAAPTLRRLLYNKQPEA